MPLANEVDFDLIEYTPPSADEVNFELISIGAQTTVHWWGISGKLGKPTDDNSHGLYGIYQMRMTKRGKVPIRMKFYTPTNPQTEAQEANRQKFADAMTAWGNLTEQQKEVYNTRAKKRQMFGWGLFIREYYQAN